MAVSAGELDDDRALVFAVQQGDTEAFTTLFKRHYPAVRRACARRLGNVVEADEAAQGAFVRALERIEQCQGDRRFGPWVHVIARYLCIDALRARDRVRPEEEPLSENRSSGGLPEDGLLDRERRRNVHLALASLPERQRDVVIARTFENRRPVEIAASLGMSVAAVDSLLLRARRGLALAYERVAGEGGAAATLTSTSAAASLGGTLAVGPQRMADGVASAGHALSNAVGEAASTAASLPPVRGIGAGVASVVMAAALAITGSVPSSPAGPPPPAPASGPATGSGATGPLGLPILPLDTDLPAAGRSSSPAVPFGADPATPLDVPVLDGSLLDGGPPAPPPDLGPIAKTVDDVTASLGVKPPSTTGSGGSSTAPASGLPPVTKLPDLTGTVPEVAGDLTGEVEDLTGSLGRGVPDVLPGAAGLRSSSKPGSEAPVSDVTGAIDDLLN